jgi:hypothetical protein
MSDIKTVAIPIPIKYSKSWHSFSDPNSQIQKYLFELIIFMKNGEKKIFRNLESNKHSSLISIRNQIKFSDINTFKVCVSKLPDDYSFNYELEGIINHENSCYSQQDANIYIEFSQNSNGFTLCNCSFIGIDFNKICISPPN